MGGCLTAVKFQWVNKGKCDRATLKLIGDNITSLCNPLISHCQMQYGISTNTEFSRHPF